MLVLEIIEGHHEVSNKTVGQGDKQRMIYLQKVYMHDPLEPFPKKALLNLENPTDAYPIGKYVVSAGSFEVNQYDSMELSRFNLKLEPLEAAFAVFSDHKPDIKTS